jgi:hypothetical protein
MGMASVMGGVMAGNYRKHVRQARRAFVGDDLVARKTNAQGVSRIQCRTVRVGIQHDGPESRPDAFV